MRNGGSVREEGARGDEKEENRKRRWRKTQKRD